MMGKTLLLGVLLLSRPAFAADPAELAARLFHRLAGTPLKLGDPRRTEMAKAIVENRWEDAAKVATSDDGFLETTVRHWAAPLGRRAEDPYGDFTDFDAMIVGTIRDDRDFREILYDDFTYVGPDKIGTPPIGPETAQFYYKALEPMGIAKVLKRKTPQASDREDSSGVLTSDGWGAEHMNDGTNRRAVVFAFREFLCTPIEELADGSVPDFRVHRDVDRSPGGLTGTYVQTCRRCHAGMDALAGAYAFFRSDETFLVDGGNFRRILKTVKDDRVVKRMNKNGDVYPQGFVTVDDSWVNLWTQGKNADLGWRGATSGRGIQSLGRMLAQTEAFSRCQAKKVFTQVCLRPPTGEDKRDLADLTRDFEANGFKMRRLFEKAALLPQCLGGAR